MHSSSINGATDASGYTPAEIERTYRKVFFRLIPLLFLCYVISYIDRVNISFAKLQFMHDLGFSESTYGFGAGLFFIGYVLFEVPSNLWMQRIGARRTLLRIMLAWGLVSSLMMFVRTPTQFYAMRFLLGVTEAGFFPGIIYYLSCWFPGARRARVTAFLMMATAVAGIVGGPLSGFIMTRLAGVGGMPGWQWLFLLEGVPAVTLGIFAFFFLGDTPAEVSWLDEREKALVARELIADEKSKHTGHLDGLRGALANPRVYLAALVYFAVMMPFNAIGFWAPTIIRDLGVANVLDVGLLSALVFIAAALGTYVVGASSDRMMERRWHVAGSAAVTALAFALLPAAGHHVAVGVGLLALAAAASYGCFVVFWTIPQTFLPRSSAAGGIAMITSLGGTGGFVSPAFVGWVKTQTGSAQYGLIGLAVVLMAGVVLLLLAFPSPGRNLVAVASAARTPRGQGFKPTQR
ncbi:major facilitator transporter [Caballeronia choica]|uniref:Major facilitator transporter n=1 Tax=Caballeronia choica TaxID=326476 RepID=A0A158JIW1_9BURK|nr:MFS transporter [Caballeronia choica]SAL68792.1 major facilitator transporter [Caballeronia choica]